MNGTAEGKRGLDPSVLHLQTLSARQAATCDDVLTMNSTDGRWCYLTQSQSDRYVKSIQAMCPSGCGCTSLDRGTGFLTGGGCPGDSVDHEDYQALLRKLPCVDINRTSPSEFLDLTENWGNAPDLRMYDLGQGLGIDLNA